MANFAINTKGRLKEKLDMVASLTDIEIATRLLSESGDESENELDGNYKKLKSKLVTLESNSTDYKIVNDYVKNTHGSSHHFTVNLLEAFKIQREGEKDRFKGSIGNEILLWHGSRLTNYVGIISQGLRIAPPEAPVTGYMFGKGVYFADMITKSAQYCWCNPSNDVGLMLLCRVACGNYNKKLQADYNANLLPAGTNRYIIYIYIYIAHWELGELPLILQNGLISEG